MHEDFKKRIQRITDPIDLVREILNHWDMINDKYYVQYTNELWNKGRELLVQDREKYGI